MTTRHKRSLSGPPHLGTRWVGLRSQVKRIEQRDLEKGTVRCPYMMTIQISARVTVMFLPHGS